MGLLANVRCHSGLLANVFPCNKFRENHCIRLFQKRSKLLLPTIWSDIFLTPTIWSDPVYHRLFRGNDSFSEGLDYYRWFELTYHVWTENSSPLLYVLTPFQSWFMDLDGVGKSRRLTTCTYEITAQMRWSNVAFFVFANTDDNTSA